MYYLWQQTSSYAALVQPTSLQGDTIPVFAGSLVAHIPAPFSWSMCHLGASSAVKKCVRQFAFAGVWGKQAPSDCSR